MSHAPAQPRPVRLGVCGLGRAFVLSRAAFESDPRVQLVAACAPRAQSRQAFERAFVGSKTYQNLADMCADEQVEAIYIATPHGLHSDQVRQVARAGKHILVDKPLAVELADAQAMLEAVQAAGVQAIVGPSHSFDAPVAQASQLIADSRFGQIRMMQAFNYTDFLYRPRRVEELHTDQGGGVVFSQAVHQIDVIRRLAAQPAQSVYACTGNWDDSRDTEGAYMAIIRFAGGLSASLTYSGYAHFDSDEWMDWAGELGQQKDPQAYGAARRALAKAANAQAEAALKSARTFGAADALAAPQFEEHFGPVIVCMDRADLRLSARGLHVYDNEASQFLPVSPGLTPRTGVVDALVAAVREGIPALQDLAWGLASLEICHAILASSRSGAPVRLVHQEPAS